MRFSMSLDERRAEGIGVRLWVTERVTKKSDRECYTMIENVAPKFLQPNRIWQMAALRGYGVLVFEKE